MTFSSLRFPTGLSFMSFCHFRFLRLAVPLCGIVLLAAFFAVPAASADVAKKLYFAGFLGLNSYLKADYEDSRTPVSGTLEFHNGSMMAGALGLRLTPEFDVEAEIAYRKTDVSNLNIEGLNRVDMGGEIGSWTAMVNGIWNFDTDWVVQPFLTGGVGVTFQSGEFDDVTGVSYDASDDDIGLAYALGGGLRYPVRDGMAFTGSYRYYGTSDLDFRDTKISYASHEFRLGLEYELGPVKLPDWLKKKKK